MSDGLWRELLAVAELLAAYSDGRVRVAINEQDETTEFDAEAQEHVKLDEKRVGRDLRLYGFMAEIAGPEAALADFAGVLLAVKTQVPAAFEAVRQRVNDLAVLMRPEYQEAWRNIWVEDGPSGSPEKTSSSR